MLAFRSWLQAVVTGAVGLPSTAPALADVREQLRLAQTRREEAGKLLEVATAATERARQAIRDAAGAEEEAAKAEADYVASAASWAAGGAQSDIIGDPALFARAEEARTRAYRAKLAAKGAAAALQATVWDETLDRARSVAITQAEADARDRLERADRDIGKAVAAILVAEVEPTLERALELHAELVSLLPLLRGFSRMCRQNVTFRPASDELARQLEQVQALPKVDENRLSNLMQPWIRFGNRLLEDGEASFEPTAS